MSSMRDLVLIFGTAVDSVMNFCAGPNSTPKAGMLFDKHRAFARSNVEPDVLSTAEPDLLLMFVPQELNPKSNIAESSEAEAAAEVFTDEIGAVLTGLRATVWEVLPELVTLQVNPCHILHFSSAYFESYSLDGISLHTALSM